MDASPNNGSHTFPVVSENLQRHFMMPMNACNPSLTWVMEYLYLLSGVWPYPLPRNDFSKKGLLVHLKLHFLKL